MQKNQKKIRGIFLAILFIWTLKFEPLKSIFVNNEGGFVKEN